MGVIIGSATRVFVGGATVQTDGIQSASWTVDMGPNRLWQLGTWKPYRTQLQKTLSCQLTTYAGVLDRVNLSVANDCTDSTAVKEITIIANACSNVPASISTFNPGDMYITSYSYSKGDATGFATESWNFQKWVALTDEELVDPDHYIGIPAPSVVIQGITEGNYSGDFDDPTKMGVRPYQSVNPVGYGVTGVTGNVSAGFPGIGDLNETVYCMIDRVGGGVLGDDADDIGKTGNSQANIQHTPLYISV